MKHHVINHLAAITLGLTALALSTTGCTADEDFGNMPEGSIPLSIGNVSVAGVETAGRTRAAISEGADGFTGIRKSRFVNGNVLTLALSNDGGATTTPVTATLTGGAWTLSPETNYILPGTTAIKATYTPAATSGMNPDVLEADPDYTLSGQKVTFNMKHANAMIDITIPAGIVTTGISVAANNGTADETLSTIVEEEAGSTMHYRTIAAPGKVKSITATINGLNYIATLATPLTVEANKRYPVSLTLKNNNLTASVGNADLNWGVGGSIDVSPAGYTRLIGTPEDLAQFAYDVNNRVPGGNSAVVLQTADIDLAKLMTADEANAAQPGKNYTYTATKDAWVSMGTYSNRFSGKYNGNGHTISNLKGEQGLFEVITNSILTGIHLRDVNITSEGGKLGTLVAEISSSTAISLCSATGVIAIKDVYAGGGLIGLITGNSVNITRCSARVDITQTGHTVYGGSCLGGFVGYINGTNVAIAGCMASGNIVYDGSVEAGAGGFIGYTDQTNSNVILIGCSATGNVEGAGTAGAFYGGGYNNKMVVAFFSCYATGTLSDATHGFGAEVTGVTYTDCAYTATQGNAVPGITGDVPVANLYATITAGNAKTTGYVKTLHWSTTDGYTLTEVNALWDATGIWKDNGASAPTVNMAYEGGEPKPIVDGNAVQEVNGYWVTAPNANKNEMYEWAHDNNATEMQNDPCKGHGGWRMPTMKDFEVMAGWTATWPWSEGVTEEPKEILSDKAAWSAIFTVGQYFSSQYQEPNKVWTMWVKPGSGGVYYYKAAITTPYFVRCVQPK